MKHTKPIRRGRHVAMALLFAGAMRTAVAADQAPAAIAQGTPLLPQSETPCFPISQIELQGDEAARFGWVLDHIAGPEGTDGPLRRCLGAAGIGVVVQRAQQALIARGFVTTRVLVAPQDLQHGHLQLTVIPGRIRQVRFADPDARNPSALNALPARSGDVLDLRDIEQALENFKRVPSASADIQIVPGEEPGHSDLQIDWSQRRPIRLNLSVDDSGSRSTDRYQGSATLDIDNPLALNDLLQLGLQGGLGGGASNRQATRGHMWHYSLPWGRALLALDVRQHDNRQAVAGASQDHVYRGTSDSREATLTWLVHRDAHSKTTLHARAFAWRSNNFINDSEVSVQRRRVGGWQLGGGHRAFVGDGTVELNLNYQRGTGAFGSLPAPEKASGEGTSHFALVQASALGQWPFTLARHPWEFSSRWRAQVHRTPLSPPERFAIGGRHTVRGFDGEFSLSAESGWTWRNELSSPLGDSGTTAFAGLDHGRVRGPSTPLLLGTRLTGAVIGLRTCACKPSAFQFELFAGWPLRKPEGFPTASTTLGFSLATDF